MAHNSVSHRNKGDDPAQQGFTLVEILIAMAIFAIGILGVASMQISAINGNSDARQYSHATLFAQDRIETLMSAPFASMPMAATSAKVTNADNYEVVTAYSFDLDGDGTDDADIDGDGSNDVIRVEVIVSDPRGKERSRLSFIKAADI